MTKVVVKKYKPCIMLLIGLLGCGVLRAQYPLHIRPVDQDSTFVQQVLGLQTNFSNRQECIGYIYKLPDYLHAKGYSTASLDSIQIDSTAARIVLYIGLSYRWGGLLADSADQKLLDRAGISLRPFDNKPLEGDQIRQLQQKLMDYLENNGYPFAAIKLDSFVLDSQQVKAKLLIDRGPLYSIDSIRIYGEANISADFMQHYLDIPNGSIYSKEKLQQVSKRLSELPYLREEQPWNLTMLGTGSILNLYLKPKRSSQVNVLVGFLPASDQLVGNKLLVTGEANINLRNALGGGEEIGVNWQQLQARSPRLDLSYKQPYLFNSPFGAAMDFNLLKKDSSYVNIRFQLEAQYAVSVTQTGSVFFRSLSTNLLTVDTATVKSTRTLPDEADVRSSSLGINYAVNRTDYRFNPRRGNELEVSLAAGIKKIRKNNLIIQLTDAADPSFDYNSLYDTVKLQQYQFNVKLSAAHYFPLGKLSVIKAALNGGWFQSPVIYRNELFQIGGYKLMRGFDEESIFASQYAVGTAEYRYLVGQNAYLFTFVDIGQVANHSVSAQVNNTYLGLGMGMSFETKAGIFNISYAVGKRDDASLNLRQSKIHLGYVNYF